MSTSPRARVLVVDDDGNDRDDLGRMLIEKNCEVRLGAGAEEARRMLQNWDCDVALIDFNMPGADGLLLLREMKKSTPDTVVLIMASGNSAEVAVRALRDGAYGYVEKPFRLDTMWTNVQRATDHRAVKLKNRQFLAEQERQTRALRSFMPTRSSEATPLGGYDEVLDQVLQAISREMGTSRVSIMLIDPECGELKIEVSCGVPEEIARNVRVPLGQGIAGGVALGSVPMLVTNIHADDRIPTPLESTLGQSFISVPIVHCDPTGSSERTLGVINVTNRRSGQPFSESDTEFLKGMASQLAIAIEGANRFEELRTTHQALRSAQDQLVFAERLKAVGQMASGVAHDFNNILSVILARTQFVLARLEDSERDIAVRTDIEAIVKASNQGADTIRRIQDYTRVRKDPPRKLVDVNSVIRNAVELARPKWKEQCRARGKHVELVFELSEVPPVRGNVHELTQVVNNLIFNAVEAMPDGGKLEFHSRLDRDVVEFEVRDSGIGMDEQVRKRVFDPFFTTKETGQGLGTAVIYGIVQRHRGEIRVESEPARGSRFLVRLPRQTGELESSEPVEPARDEPCRPATVLLVDNDQLVRETFEEGLRDAGHQVVSADGGERALQLFSADNFDAVITDLSMSGMNGLDLARQVKLLAPSVPVILVSGWAFDQGEEANECIDVVIHKPCVVDDLCRTVQGAIRNRSPVCS